MVSIWLPQFIFPMSVDMFPFSDNFTSSFFIFLVIAFVNRCEVIFHCGFHLHFPND